MPSNSTSPLLRPPHAADYVGLSTMTLARYRRIGGGPPFIRLSSTAVGYLRSDLDAWLLSRRRTSTSDQGAAPVASSTPVTPVAPVRRSA